MAAPDHLPVSLAQVADLGRLTTAWDEVLAGDRDDGMLGPGVARFARDAEQNLAKMASQLSVGGYRPGHLAPVSLPRADGQVRLLHVPVVRDRIVERSILAVLGPVIDPWLGPFSYAYRPGLGVADAVQAVARLRDEGLGWVARSDFHDCFTEIPVSRLRRMLRVLVEDPVLLALIEDLLDRPAAAPHGAAPVRGLRSWALASEVELVFLSRRGTYLGQAWTAVAGRRISRLRAQLAVAGDPARAPPFARAVVDAKVRKQMVLLQRLARRDNTEIVSSAVGQISELLAMLPQCGTRDELMGIEGAAAREYFAALGQIMPDGLRFVGRSRQPPGDLINAALSYGYAIILGEAVSALCATGLDPAIGLLHAEQDNRPSLALDLMEEFRPLVVDQLVVAAARRGELRPEHGHREEAVHGVLLTKAGREVIVGQYEQRMLQHTKGALPGLSGSMRRHLYRQAERLAAYVHDPLATWTGLSWR